MVAANFLHDSQVRQWLDGVEPAWTLLTFDSLRALRQEPSAGQTAIQIANDLSIDEIAASAVARNTLTDVAVHGAEVVHYHVDGVEPVDQFFFGAHIVMVATIHR